MHVAQEGHADGGAGEGQDAGAGEWVHLLDVAQEGHVDAGAVAGASGTQVRHAAGRRDVSHYGKGPSEWVQENRLQGFVQQRQRLVCVCISNLYDIMQYT